MCRISIIYIEFVKCEIQYWLAMKKLQFSMYSKWRVFCFREGYAWAKLHILKQKSKGRIKKNSANRY